MRGGRLNLNSQALTHLSVCHLKSPKTDVCVVKLLAATFGDQRSKVLEKKVNETQVSKTVFGHLNRYDQ